MYVYIYIYVYIYRFIYEYIYSYNRICIYNDNCFYYHSRRNNVVIAFGTLSSFIT